MEIELVVHSLPPGTNYAALSCVGSNGATRASASVSEPVPGPVVCLCVGFSDNESGLPRLRRWPEPKSVVAPKV